MTLMFRLYSYGNEYGDGLAIPWSYGENAIHEYQVSVFQMLTTKMSEFTNRMPLVPSPRQNWLGFQTTATFPPGGYSPHPSLLTPPRQPVYQLEPQYPHPRQGFSAYPTYVPSPRQSSPWPQLGASQWSEPSAQPQAPGFFLRSPIHSVYTPVQSPQLSIPTPQLPSPPTLQVPRLPQAHAPPTPELQLPPLPSTSPPPVPDQLSVLQPPPPPLTHAACNPDLPTQPPTRPREQQKKVLATQEKQARKLAADARRLKNKVLNEAILGFLSAQEAKIVELAKEHNVKADFIRTKIQHLLKRKNMDRPSVYQAAVHHLGEELSTGDSLVSTRTVF